MLPTITSIGVPGIKLALNPADTPAKAAAIPISGFFFNPTYNIPASGINIIYPASVAILLIIPKNTKTTGKNLSETFNPTFLIKTDSRPDSSASPTPSITINIVPRTPPPYANQLFNNAFPKIHLKFSAANIFLIS